MKKTTKSSSHLIRTFLVIGSLVGGAYGDVMVNFMDAGSGTSDMTILASGTVTSVNSFFTYDTATSTFNGTADYNNITITPISTGDGSAPFNRLRVKGGDGVFSTGSVFQLWTGSSSVNSPFDLSSMNGTYNVPVDYSLLTEGTWTLNYEAGMDVGEVSVTVGAIPEPSTISFFGITMTAILAFRRNKKYLIR